jgi:hypothetical protein
MNEFQRLRDDPRRLLNTLVLVNVAIWMISIIAMIFLIQDAPVVKKLAPILMAGAGAGVALISVISRKA